VAVAKANITMTYKQK